MPQKKMKKPETAVFNAALGAVAGAVFHRIKYRDQHERFGVVRAGVKWIAQSLEAWSFETGFTIRQVKNAIARMRKDGFILTRQGLFQNKNVLHVAIDSKGRDLIDQAVLEWEKPGPDEGLKEGVQGLLEEPLDCLPECTQSGPLYNTTEPSTELSTDLGEPVPGSQEGQDQLDSNSGVDDMKLFKTVEDALAAAKTPKPKKMSTPLDELKQVWHDAYNDYTEGKYSGALTGEKLGMLKTMIKHSDKVPAKEIVAHTIKNWPLFVNRVKSETGNKASPTDPVIPYLLTHYTIAKALFTKNAVDPATKAKAKPLPHVIVKPAIPDQPSTPLEDVLVAISQKPSVNTDG